MTAPKQYESWSRWNAVYVIELLDSDDDQTGTRLFNEVLSPLGQEYGVATQLIKVGRNDALIPALEEIWLDCRTKNLGPVLHFEMHGSQTGVGAPKGGAFVPWRALVEPLTRINLLSRGNLVLTMAACYGAAVLKVLAGAKQMPVCAVVGPTTQVLPSDIEQGFRAFYASMIAGNDLNSAMADLRKADKSFPEGWRFDTAERLFAIAYGMHRVTMDGPGGRREAEQKLVKKARRFDRKHGQERPTLRRQARAHLSTPEPFFQKVKRKFLMIDAFPENEERFTVTEADCRHVFEEWKKGKERR